MEPETRYTVIGATVLALVCAAIGGFLWLSSFGRGSDFRFYTVYFEHQSLDGLQVGSNVNMRGITVGRVEDLALSADNINRVQVTLRVRRETPVRTNTRAAVSRNIVTGIARINLVTRGDPGPELTAAPEGERHPVIAEGTSSLDAFTDAANRLAASADQGLANVNRLLGDPNQKAFAELLVNLRDLAAGLNARLGTVDRSAQSFDKTAADLRTSAQRIADSAERIGSSLEPVAKDASTALREAQVALQTFTRATNKLEQDLAQVLKGFERDSGTLTRRVDDALDVGMLELRATADELRSSAEIVSRTLDRLREPRAALLGPATPQLGPGEARQ